MRERRERKESLLWITLVILLFTYMTISSVRMVKAQATPKVFVDPKVSTAEPTQNFTIAINVSDISASRSLYGWEFEMSFNTTVLNVIKVAQGPFLKTASNFTLFIRKTNNTAGTVQALGTITEFPYPPQGAVGNGTLCTITFLVEAKGATLLHFDYTELYTVVQDVNVPIDHTCEDGFFANIHDVAVTNLAVPTTATLGDVVSIKMIVVNHGCYNESVSVATYCDDTPINTTAIDMLLSGESEIVEFSWNTTGLALGTYTINATATIALDDDPGDNFKTTTIEIKPYIFHVPELDFNVIVDSNSTLSNFDFRQDDKELRFTVSGPTGTTGYCNVAIPMDKMKGNPWTIFVDGEAVTPIDQSDNGTHTFLYFTYTHSTKNVIIRGTWVVPEFPTLIPLLLTLAFLAVSTIVLKRKIDNNC